MVVTSDMECAPMRHSPDSVVWAVRPGPLYHILRVTLPVLSLLIALDQLSKWLLAQIFPITQVRLVGGDYEITQRFHIEKLLSANNLIRLTALLMLLGVGCYLLSRLWTAPSGYFAIGLLTGGSFSNLFDYVRHGKAHEWVGIRGWPALSLADIAVGIGGLLFFGILLRRMRQVSR